MSAEIHVLAGAERRRARMAGDFAAAVLAGLSDQPKRLSSRYFYDDEGSALFARLCGEPAYYPPRCERAILQAHGEELCARMGEGAWLLVDLGAGDGHKTRLLLDPLAARATPVRYAPIDISEGAIRDLVARTSGELPALEVSALVGDYDEGLAWLQERHPDERKLVLFLGSTIGNFRRPEARAFLWRLRQACAPGDRLLIGFDLKKDLEVLRAAYNDPAGISAAFNRNLLLRINRELGADFQPERFQHFASYNVDSGAMESCLLSLEPQIVRAPGLGTSFHFADHEPLHLEFSYKFLRSDIEELAMAAGFTIEAQWLDERGWFVDSLWRVESAGRFRASVPGSR
ncbi:MAG: L-histidine N(alpha)-methyltransferase [Deltaproteobacteria bacterium]|nr:L-histidine N(alpha)-methyltransferase [Deltaproteobacteria bacterium]